MNPDRLLLFAMYGVLAGVVLMFAGNQLAGNPNFGFLSPVALWTGIGVMLAAGVCGFLAWRRKDGE